MLPMGQKPAHTKVPGLLQGVKQEGIGPSYSALLLQEVRDKEFRHTNMAPTSRTLKIHLPKIITTSYTDVCTLRSCSLWGVSTFAMKIRTSSLLKVIKRLRIICNLMM